MLMLSSDIQNTDLMEYIKIYNNEHGLQHSIIWVSLPQIC